MSFLPNDQVWVENLDDHPLEFGWNSRYVTIEPGKRELVQVEAAINAFGDPRSGPELSKFSIGDEVHFIPSRGEEVARLQTRYGSEGLRPDQHLRVDDPPPNAPKVKVSTIHGETLTMVVDDPTGSQRAPSVAPTDAADQLAQLQKQVAALQNLIATTQAEVADVELPADMPQPVAQTVPGSGPPITPEAVPVMPQPEVPSDQPGG